MLLESQSNPSYNPSPEVAHVLWIYLQNIYISISAIMRIEVLVVATLHIDSKGRENENGGFLIISYTNGVVEENEGQAYP